MSPTMTETLIPATPDFSSNPTKAPIFLNDQSPLMDQPKKPSLSKPRLAKTRKSASSKSRPSFSSHDRSEKVEEKLASWNPFSPESRVSGTEPFVFRMGDGLSRDSSRNSSVEGGSRDLSRDSSIGLEDGRKLNVEKSGHFGEGVFVFGSSFKDTSVNAASVGSSNSASRGAFVFGKSEESDGFVFGKSKVTTLHDHSGTFNNEKGTVNVVDAAPFVFGSQASSNEQDASRLSKGTDQNEHACSTSNNKIIEEPDVSRSTTEINRKEQVAAKNDFLVGVSKNVFGSFGGSEVSTEDDNVAKPSSGSIGSMGSVPPFQTTVPIPSPNIPQIGNQFTFTSKPEGLETQNVKLNIPSQEAPRLTKENLFSGPSQNIRSSVKRGEVKGTKSKKKRGKSRIPALNHRSFATQSVPVETLQENPETEVTEPPCDYSPMDCSPYREETVVEQYSRQASVVSEDSAHFASSCASIDMQNSSSVDRDEVVVSAEEKLDADEGRDTNRGEIGDNGSIDHVQRCYSASSSFEAEQIFGYREGSDMPKYENVAFDSLGMNNDIQASGGKHGYIFSSSQEDFSQSKFSFTSTTSVEGPLSAQKRNYRRKGKTKPVQATYQKKHVQESFSYTPSSGFTFGSPSVNIFPPASDQPPLQSVREHKECSPVFTNEDGDKKEKNKEAVAASVAAQEACEKWRYRGNQAYSHGFSSKAEDYYTRGINSVLQKDTPKNCIHPLILCYSNRAATRMSLGRMREAIDDCKMALSIDPNFLRAEVRAANCYLSLGEIPETLKAFKKCLKSKDINSNEKILKEASDGLEKAKRVADLTNQCAELLLKRTPDDASKALHIVSEALSISPLSESLMEMKAEALLMMRRYEEVIKFCQEKVDMTENNSAVPEVDSSLKDVVGSEVLKGSSGGLWRQRLISKSYFYLGKLEEALELLCKHDKVKSAADEHGSSSSNSLTSLAVTIRELLRLKAAGNEAFQAARHSEAVECYTAALACNAESRPFAAVCFGNRAAAFQALGQIADAIADCSLAIALDASYPKAISRRATLHEMIRDYGQATNDLQRLISLLEKRLKQNNGQSEATGYSNDLRKARSRLVAMEEEAKKERSLDMYKILGVEQSSTAADVKKAYRKAALRHHPDKAGQFLARNENVDDGLWKDLADEVRTDADRLFKMIGESYTTLSDPDKRLQYDDEEEMRSARKSYNSPKSYYSPHASKTPTYNYRSHYERKFNMRQWQAYGNSSNGWDFRD